MGVGDFEDSYSLNSRQVEAAIRLPRDWVIENFENKAVGPVEVNGTLSFSVASQLVEARLGKGREVGQRGRCVKLRESELDLQALFRT